MRIPYCVGGVYFDHSCKSFLVEGFVDSPLLFFHLRHLFSMSFSHQFILMGGGRGGGGRGGGRGRGRGGGGRREEGGGRREEGGGRREEGGGRREEGGGRREEGGGRREEGGGIVILGGLCELRIRLLKSNICIFFLFF